MTDPELISKLKSKLARQRTEIARLTQRLETATKEKSALVRDIKWLRGEKPDG
jgi:hypothetical protein